jgi:anti-sigma regulatory factor (Ser/Thr protein kinase)
MADVCHDLDRELYEVASLLTSELVTNAIEHSSGDIELLVSTSGTRLHVEVRDYADGRPKLLESAVMSTKGRGLMLVERLAIRWGVKESTTSSGKSVWFELPIDR